MNIRTLIVDDMPLARSRLRRHLEPDPEIELVGEAKNGSEAIEMIRTLSPQLVLLDIQMPEVDGFEVLEAVGPDAVPAVIFVTAYDEFALRAFDVHALDYLLKPFDADRLAAALARAKRQLASTGNAAGQLSALLDEWKEKRRHVSRLAVRSRDRMVFVPVDDIDYIEAAGNYLRLHAGAESHLIRDRIGELEAKLDPELFVRIHRSTIVNITRVREMHPMFNGDQLLVLKNGARLTVSRTFRVKVLEVLEAL
jgi:two-component system, LytTR family, response regulator